MIQNLINHVGLAIDESSSMANQPVVEVADAALERLKQSSIDLNQETRISIYKFADKVECIAFDMDVMRFKTLKGYYRSYGNTALIDATAKCIEDHQKLPELYGDHAFLIYVITDGQENASRNGGIDFLRSKIRTIPKANWTMACLVPDAVGKRDAKNFGFPDESIAVWDTSSKVGFEKVGKQFTSAMDNYMTMRASGIRTTSSLFTMDSSALTKSVLAKINPAMYDIIPIHTRDSKGVEIKAYVESWIKAPYRLGSTYYQPTKKVKIQDHKNILVQEVKTGTVYEGYNLRQMLGLPTQTAEVDPGQHREWRIFVQSTSTNRKLFDATFALVMK